MLATQHARARREGGGDGRQMVTTCSRSDTLMHTEQRENAFAALDGPCST